MIVSPRSWSRRTGEAWSKSVAAPARMLGKESDGLSMHECYTAAPTASSSCHNMQCFEAGLCMHPGAALQVHADMEPPDAGS